MGSFARLDDGATLQAAIADPEGFVAHGDAPRAIDEVQRGGHALVRGVHATLDADSSPGQFLLNGSADFLTVPTLSESLAGRAVFHELHHLRDRDAPRSTSSPNHRMAESLRSRSRHHGR